MLKLNDRIAQLCKMKGIKRQDLPELCGVARETPYRGVKGRATLAALAYGLGVTVDELVSGTEAEELWRYGPGGR